MKYLITGHTGFKGSWLSAMLKVLGHEVHGIALDPEERSLYNQAKVHEYLSNDFRLDIRDKESLEEAVKIIDPEIIIHLAAQPLVRASYSDPIGTYHTNVLGTLNVLESTRYLQDLKATLVITTDKVYRNKNQLKGYLESDELGGDDPYSSSKAAADIASQSWRKSFGKSPIAIARAGNVIGGGDWSKDRIIPDIVESIQNNSFLTLRNPDAVRPWQHVLDCLNGYLILVESQIQSNTQGEWNFGPSENGIRSVKQLVEEFFACSGYSVPVNINESSLHESNLLVLNSEKSQGQLGWSNKLDFKSTIKWTVDWYKDLDEKTITQKQIEKFLSIN